MFREYKILLNLKAACLYEALAEKPYSEANTIDDMMMLFYSCIAANNTLDFTYNIFVKILQQKRVAREAMEVINNLQSYSQQFHPRKGEKEEGVEEDDKEVPWMTDVRDFLIINCGIDSNFVLNLDLWDLENVVRSALNNRKGDLIEKRLFAFLQMSPLRLPKDAKGPEDILPFAWEADEKEKRQQDDLSKHTQAVLGLFKKKEDNGNRGIDNSAGPEGLPENGKAPLGNGECGKDSSGE